MVTLHKALDQFGVRATAALTTATPSRLAELVPGIQQARRDAYAVSGTCSSKMEIIGGTDADVRAPKTASGTATEQSSVGIHHGNASPATILSTAA